MTIAGFAGVAHGARPPAAPRRRSRGHGRLQVITPLGSVFGPSIFVGLIGLTGGYLVPYLVLAGVTLVVGVFVLRK